MKTIYLLVLATTKTFPTSVSGHFCCVEIWFTAQLKSLQWHTHSVLHTMQKRKMVVNETTVQHRMHWPYKQNTVANIHNFQWCEVGSNRWSLTCVKTYGTLVRLQTNCFCVLFSTNENAVNITAQRAKPIVMNDPNKKIDVSLSSVSNQQFLRYLSKCVDGR